MPATRNTRSRAVKALDTPASRPSSASEPTLPQRKKTTKKKPANKPQPRARVQVEPAAAEEPDSDSSEIIPDPQPGPIPKTVIKAAGNFVSRFPGLEVDDFEEHLDEWTLTGLQEAITKQDSKSTKAPTEIRALVKTIRLEYEKRMLMAALMGGVPEAVVWTLVGEGAKKSHGNPWIRFLGFCLLALAEKLPPATDKEAWVARNQLMSDIWNGLSPEEKAIFRDPYFFALAGLPNLALGRTDEDDNSDEEGEENDYRFEDLEASIAAPKVHELCEADKLKYQPLFDRLVDVEKLHLCHGQPDRSQSLKKLQQKSLAELRKAHHDFSVVCQRYHISYYLTAASCGSVEGWSQVFSNNSQFALWARNEVKIPLKFSTYVHGKDSAKEIEKKPQQPSDERKTRLGHLLNKLMDEKLPGKIFPKQEDPKGVIKRKGWAVRIVLEPGSRLVASELFKGHRCAVDSTVQKWLKDLADNLFSIVPISEARAAANLENISNRTRKNKSNTKHKAPSKPQHSRRKQHKNTSTSHTSTRRDAETSDEDLSLPSTGPSRAHHSDNRARKRAPAEDEFDHAGYVADLRTNSRKDAGRFHDSESNRRAPKRPRVRVSDSASTDRDEDPLDRSQVGSRSDDSNQRVPQQSGSGRNNNKDSDDEDSQPLNNRKSRFLQCPPSC